MALNDFYKLGAIFAQYTVDIGNKYNLNWHLDELTSWEFRNDSDNLTSCNMMKLKILVGKSWPFEILLKRLII